MLVDSILRVFSCIWSNPFCSLELTASTDELKFPFCSTRSFITTSRDKSFSLSCILIGYVLGLRADLISVREFWMNLIPLFLFLVSLTGLYSASELKPSPLKQDWQSQRHPLIRPIEMTSSSGRPVQAPWYQIEQLSRNARLVPVFENTLETATLGCWSRHFCHQNRKVFTMFITTNKLLVVIDTSREIKNWVCLQKLLTRQSIGRLCRLHEPAGTEEQTSKIDVENYQWTFLRIKRVHLAALLRLPLVPELHFKMTTWALSPAAIASNSQQQQYS